MYEATGIVPLPPPPARHPGHNTSAISSGFLGRPVRIPKDAPYPGYCNEFIAGDTGMVSRVRTIRRALAVWAGALARGPTPWSGLPQLRDSRTGASGAVHGDRPTG